MRAYFVHVPFVHLYSYVLMVREKTPNFNKNKARFISFIVFVLLKSGSFRDGYILALEIYYKG